MVQTAKRMNQHQRTTKNFSLTVLRGSRQRPSTVATVPEGPNMGKLHFVTVGNTENIILNQ